MSNTCGTQPALFGKSTLQRFAEFHDLNPDIYCRLRSKALQALALGFKRYSMRAIWEVVRWDYNIADAEDPSSGFKMNDHYVPHYARLLMRNEPALADFFELRKQGGLT